METLTMDQQHDDDMLERRLNEYYAHAQPGPAPTATWARLAPMLDQAPSDIATNGWRATIPDRLMHTSLTPAATGGKPQTRRIWTLGAVFAALLLIALAVGIFTELGNQRGSHKNQVITPPAPTCSAKSISADLPNGLTLHTITMTAPDEGWAVGNASSVSSAGIILHYSQCRWSVAASGFSGFDISAIAMASPNEGWAEGGSLNGDMKRLLLHYSNGHWEQMAIPIELPAQTAQGQLAMRRGEGWVSYFVGTDADKHEIWRLYHYANGTWSEIPAPSGLDPLSSDFAAFPGTGIVSLGPDDAWLLAYDPITGVSIPAHYQAGQWTTWQMPAGWNIGQIMLSSPTDGWAMGSSVNPVYPTNTPAKYAPIMLRFDGHAWTPVPLPVDQALLYGWLAAPGDGWVFAVKQNPRSSGSVLGTETVTAVYHYLNGIWQQVNWPFENGAPLLVGAIERASNGDYWATGLQSDPTSNKSGSVLLHYANGQWTKYGQP